MEYFIFSKKNLTYADIQEKLNHRQGNGDMYECSLKFNVRFNILMFGSVHLNLYVFLISYKNISLPDTGVLEHQSEVYEIYFVEDRGLNVDE